MKFSRCSILFGDFSWNIQGFQHAAIFDRFFKGCQHGVDERVSARGALSERYIFNTYKGWAFSVKCRKIHFLILCASKFRAIVSGVQEKSVYSFG